MDFIQYVHTYVCTVCMYCIYVQYVHMYCMPLCVDSVHCLFGTESVCDVCIHSTVETGYKEHSYSKFLHNIIVNKFM